MDKLRAEDKSLDQFFSLKTCEMDSSTKEERARGQKVNRAVVYCNNLSGLIARVHQHRGFHPRTRYFVKVGIDGGGSFLKICLNLEKQDDEFSSPASQKTKWSYAAGACSDKFKDSGVRKLMILAMVENASESYSNLKLLLDLLELNTILRSEDISYSYAFDMKLANGFLGLGTAASTYPCPWCELPKSDFANPDLLFNGGKLRTLGSIREHAGKYQAAAENHTGKNKLSSAPFYSCEQVPLCEFDDDSMLVLDLVPPMELHLMLGVVNNLYYCLDGRLKRKACSISAKDWAAPLGLARSAHYGGQFNGNQCRTLLSNTDSLKQMLQREGALNVGEPVLNAFIAFNMVRNACFGMTCSADFEIHVRRFAEAFLELDLSVTPKIHAVFVHVPQFLIRQKCPNKGLGHWSEQASEAVHSDFDSLWVGSSYKRAMSHKEYGTQLHKCVITYNSRHQ